MADLTLDRPFDNYRTAITDPAEFFGREGWLGSMRRAPVRRVQILLGGRRFGKTSALRALEWSLLDRTTRPNDRPFPVFVDLASEQPKDFPNFLYILIDELRCAIERWRQSPWQGLRRSYNGFLRQIAGAEVTLAFLKLTISNPIHDRSLAQNDFKDALLATINELLGEGFSGVCFLLDEAEFIVRQAWANDAWSYLRSLKDNNPRIQPLLGFWVSGYRGVREYQQKLGSPLYNIADVDWLPPLSPTEMEMLSRYRAKKEGHHLCESEIQLVMEWAGGHPFLAQQMLNTMLDNKRSGSTADEARLISSFIYERDHDFSSWWNTDGKSDGFGDADRKVYVAIQQQRQDSTENLARRVSISVNQTKRALQLLAGTGVIQQVDVENYKMGSRVFEQWVVRENPKLASAECGR